MKRIIAMLLVLAMLLSLMACSDGTPAESEVPEPSVTATEPASTATEPIVEEISAEVSRAISHGFVPEEIQGDYHAAITFRQYCQMLTNLIAIWDESRLPEWEDRITLAAQSDAEMKREDGILVTAYAMVLMGKNSPTTFFDLNHESVGGYLNDNLNDDKERPSWNYPFFPDWETTGFEWCGSNYMWGGVTTCAIKTSHVSGLAIYPYDFEAKSAHLHDALTREEAICAVLRLGETDSVILEPKGNYLSLTETGTYDKSIITEELLNKTTALPEITQSKLPAGWKGTGLSASKNEGTLRKDQFLDFKETDIKLLADNGFNFTRVFFSFSSLRFPDFPEDARLVNENELKDLDQLIAWGIQYGVHIQIAMNMYMDEDGNSMHDGSMPKNDAQWNLVNDYWTMLTKRYTGIPSTYLSFDLCNETQPDDRELSYAKGKLGEMVASIRGADADRVLLYSFPGNPNENWVKAVASMGLAIGCHPYYPDYITTTDSDYSKQNPYAYPSWPQPWFPLQKVFRGNAPLILRGEIADTELSLYIMESSKQANITIKCDGNVLEVLNISSNESIDRDRYRHNQLHTVSIPSGTEEVTIQVGRGTYAEIATVMVNGDMGEIIMVPHDLRGIPEYADPLPMIIRADGTYANSEGRIIDGEAIYQADIKPYQDIAAQYDVGFMVNEFGMFGNNLDWDNKIVTAYHDTVLQMLTEQNIGWCYCELYNTVSKHLTVMPGIAETEFQWNNATEELQTVVCDSGESFDYIINKELMEVFRKYTIN